MKTTSTSLEQTKQIAQDTLLSLRASSNERGNPLNKIASSALPHSNDNAYILALTGELGTGKTAFAQGIADVLGIDHMSSPTFTLMNVYNITRSGIRSANPTSLVHVDCYRLEHAVELLDIGLKEYLEDPQALVVIEWAEKIKEILPSDTLWISFKHGSEENERRISIPATSNS